MPLILTMIGYLLLIFITTIDTKPSNEFCEGCSPTTGTHVFTHSAASGYSGGPIVGQPIPLNVVLRPGEYIPNCGCVTRGSCQREIGEYTRLVGQYSDVVCGLKFEKCCFDGPCPGVLDEFVRAAACVPEERCLRPYGILPTDVRDFGIIAPCPGHGSVRCIAVDDAALLEFQAAVAAIEASSLEYIEDNSISTIPAPAPAPAKVVPVPIHVTTPLVNPPPPTTTTSIAYPVNPPSFAYPVYPPITYPGETYAYNQTPTLVTPNVALTGTGTSITSISPATDKSTYTSTSVTSVSPSTSSTGYTYTSKPSSSDNYDDDNRSTALAVQQRPKPVLPSKPVVPIYPGYGFGFRKHFSFSKGFGLYGK